MRITILSKHLSLLICTLLFTAFLAAQTTHIVDNNVGTTPDFTDVQSAIDAAADGDIIYVQQSATNYGSVQIANKGLTIIGRSHSDSGYKTQLTITLLENSSNTTIKGIEGSIQESVIAVVGAIENIVISDCKLSSLSLNSSNNKNNILIQGNVLNSISCASGTPGNVLVTNNVFNTSSINFGNPDTVLFTNNIIRVNGSFISSSNTETLNISNCIFIANFDFFGIQDITINMSGNYQINNCLTYYYNGTSLTFGTNTSPVNTVQNTLLNTNPLFTSVNPTSSPGSIAYSQFNPIDDDLTLQASSLAIGSGSGGVDMGIFEGYNFKNFGTPTGYPSIKIDSYSATVPKNSDLTVTIKAKTN